MALELSELKLISASNIIKLRTEAGMTQAELGAKLNYSDKTISKWERGEAIPDAYVLTQLAEIFSVTVDYILSSHTAWVSPETLAQEKAEPGYSVTAIIALTMVGIWTLALTIFIALWIYGVMLPQVFLVALPVSLLVYMILICAFRRTQYLFFVVSAFVLSLILMIYFFLPVRHPWQIFLIAVPALLIVFLSFNIRRKTDNTSDSANQNR